MMASGPSQASVVEDSKAWSRLPQPSLALVDPRPSSWVPAVKGLDQLRILRSQ